MVPSPQPRNPIFAAPRLDHLHFVDLVVIFAAPLKIAFPQQHFLHGMEDCFGRITVDQILLLIVIHYY